MRRIENVQTLHDGAGKGKRHRGQGGQPLPTMIRVCVLRLVGNTMPMQQATGTAKVSPTAAAGARAKSVGLLGGLARSSRSTRRKRCEPGTRPCERHVLVSLSPHHPSSPPAFVSWIGELCRPGCCVCQPVRATVEQAAGCIRRSPASGGLGTPSRPRPVSERTGRLPQR